VRDQLAEYAPRHEELSEVCGRGEDLARHLHVAAHDGVSSTPLYAHRAKRWLRKGQNELLDRIESNELPATWEPLPPQPSRTTKHAPDSARVPISA
jgi:hypothetical protein